MESSLCCYLWKRFECGAQMASSAVRVVGKGTNICAPPRQTGVSAVWHVNHTWMSQAFYSTFVCTLCVQLVKCRRITMEMRQSIDKEKCMVGFKRQHSMHAPYIPQNTNTYVHIHEQTQLSVLCQSLIKVEPLMPALKHYPASPHHALALQTIIFKFYVILSVAVICWGKRWKHSTKSAKSRTRQFLHHP